jgi:uncharacterized membrane protein YeaQ/YmgE (transglycosylase-associated protein family)
MAVPLHRGNSCSLSDQLVLACLDRAHKRCLKFFVLENRRSFVGGTIMAIEALIVWLVIGAIAGWLAGMLVKGYGFGLVGNIVVGIAGAFIAGWLLPQIGFILAGGILATIVNAVIGAVILLLVIGFLKRAA